jgi:hypothetical protein
MGTFGSIVPRLLSLRSAPSLEMEDGLTQQRPPSVWSSSESILDKLVHVQHPEGPGLLIVNSSVKSHSVWKERKVKSHSVWKGRKDTPDKSFYKVYYITRDILYALKISHKLRDLRRYYKLFTFISVDMEILTP